MDSPVTSSPTPKIEEDDLRTLIEKTNAIDSEQAEFNQLGKDQKLDRLNNLIQKSQVYSQIIADNILKSSFNRKQKNESLPTPPNEIKSTPTRKSHKSKRKPSNLGDIMNMILKSQKKEPEKPSSATPDHNSTKQPKYIIGTMKDYQLDGLHWLTTLYENGLNGILADEMGLGKTLQCIAFLAFLLEQGISGPFLVTVPLSTLTNWTQEFKKFAPGIKVFRYAGDKPTRELFDLNDLIRNQKFSVIITSYEISIKDFNKFNSINWNYLIVDEGHRLKNSNCVLVRFLKQLPVSNRLLITGTPLQNNLTELWSLLNFILPDIFSDLNFFQQWFNFDDLTKFDDDDEETRNLIKGNIQENLIKNLHTILKPFILRRLKIDVIKNLPNKKEYLIHIPLTPLQRKIYSDTIDRKLPASLMECYMKQYVRINLSSQFKSEDDYKLVDLILKNGPKSAAKPEQKRKRKYKEADSDDDFDNTSEVTEADVLTPNYDLLISKTLKKKLNKLEMQTQLLELLYAKIHKEIRHMSLQNMMMQLRNICNSPYIFYNPFLLEDDSDDFMDLLVTNSAKFQVLETLCSRLFAKGHKVLIFSQFTKVLDLIHDWLEHKNIEVCRIDGSVSHESRDDEIKSFYQDGDKLVFLLSTRSGGLGINLVPADTVILFDNDWNPQMDLQAIDRVHRIGQTKPVKIFRFVIRNSIEEILISKSSNKRFLEKLIIQMGEFKFNKLKKIMENEDADKNVGLNVKELLELSRTLLRVNDKTVGQEVELKYDLTVLHEPKELLSEDELTELLDRSPECYLADDSKSFENITKFETVNNLDK